MKWREAVRELVLIVVGVTIALAGGAWYESRTERRDERLVLLQLAEALQLDRASLTETRNIRAAQLADVRLLAAAYESGVHMSEDLNYGAVLQFVTIETNSAPYEALKSRGFDLITNASLRLSLIRYYEDVFPGVSGSAENDREFYFRSANPYFLEHFRLTPAAASPAARPLPLSVDELHRDPHFWNLLATKRQRLEARLLPYLDVAIALADSLQNEIREEVEAT